MRVFIQITDDNGAVFEGVTELTPAGERLTAKRPLEQRERPPITVKPSDFKLNPRAFMKKYGHRLNAQRKFALLVARLAEGRSGAEVSSDLVRANWDRMKRIMGGSYNSAYPVWAKENGWIDSSKRGVFILGENWVTAIKDI